MSDRASYYNREWGMTLYPVPWDVKRERDEDDEGDARELRRLQARAVELGAHPDDAARASNFHLCEYIAAFERSAVMLEYVARAFRR